MHSRLIMIKLCTFPKGYRPSQTTLFRLRNKEASKHHNRVSNWNKSSEFTLLTFTTFVPRPKKVKKFFLKFLDTILIPPWAIEVCCYIKKLILSYRLVPELIFFILPSRATLKKDTIGLNLIVI